MKKRFLKTIFVLFCILICTTLTTTADNISNKYNPDNAAVTNFTTDSTVNMYINSVNEQNSELIKTDAEDIITTITFSESMSADELTVYINNYKIEAVQLQARGYDKYGNRITFFSKTELGIDATFEMLANMANDDDIEFAGVIGMYALTDSTYINAIQNDEKTFLIDTSANEQYNESFISTFQINAGTTTESTKRNFVNSIAWDAEDLGLVSYEVLD